MTPTALVYLKRGRERNSAILTRHPSRWSAALALMIGAAPLFAAAPPVLAQSPVVPGPQAAPGLPPPPPVAPPVSVTPAAPGPPGVAAVVNGTNIYKTQVADLAVTQVGPQILNTLVLIELIRQEAAKQHIVITPAQLDAQVETVRQSAAAHNVPGGLDSVLAQRHQTLDSFKQEQILPQLEAEALVEKTLPPASSVVQYHVAHLLVATIALPGTAPGTGTVHTDAQARAIIAKAQAELKSGKSFAEVANEYTEDPSGKGHGGNLPPFAATDTNIDQNFLKAAVALKPGQTTAAPVKSAFGYHLIKLISTSAAPGAVDKTLYTTAAAALRHRQVEAAIQPYVLNLRKSAKVVDYLGQ